ncbi:hypothetical protein JHK84_057185 [Glycine max]|nr:hypothetical protein JHK86_057124 [Glycine max]KAG5075954.1 hypothetical protein JHK84_057185 [Glycine max]
MTNNIEQPMTKTPINPLNRYTILSEPSPLFVAHLCALHCIISSLASINIGCLLFRHSRQH